MTQTAIDILQGIQRATHEHAAPMPLKESNEPVWQGIGFQLGGVRMVSPMGEVSELLQPPKVAYLPGVKPWVLGVANVRGSLIPIIDLHKLLGLESTVSPTLWRVLVVDDGHVAAGFLVELSLGIQHFMLNAFEPPGADVPSAFAPFVRGVYRHGGRVFYEAKLTSILADERFFDVAASPQEPHRELATKE